MSFQRSYSKVWWGSDNNQLSSAAGIVGSSFTSGGLYSYYTQPQHPPQQQQQQQQQQLQQQQQAQEQQQEQCTTATGSTDYHSLDSNNYKSYAANLSRIQEVDDEQNNSKLSWHKHDSPGSLRSQDSGFSDNDESQSTRSLSGRSSKKPISPESPGAKSLNSSNASTQSARSIATPPTVVRRVGNSAFYSPLVSVTRRISFNAHGTPNRTLTDDTDGMAAIEVSQENDVDDVNTTKLFAQLDSMQLSNGTPKKQKTHSFDEDDTGTLQQALPATPPQPTRRRKRGMRKVSQRRILQDEIAAVDVSTVSGDNNNETVYLGATPPSYNNETVVFGGALNETPTAVNNNTNKFDVSLLRGRFIASTSTPNAKTVAAKQRPQYGSTTLYAKPLAVHENPLLNGHTPDLQHWLTDLRCSYDQEVMATLQTKSIAQEAFKNFTITTSSVAKLIRQLQQRALALQSGFERLERILSGTQDATLQDALSSAETLIAHVADFTKVLERRVIFFTETRVERRKFEENLEQIRSITKDTRYSLERQHYINLESLLDDVQVLKRYLLITIRLIVERMVHIIVQSIEQCRNDMLLRANLNMIATLTNIPYEGFASLTDAFVQNEAVRALLIIVLDHKLTSVRALALRALTTICCAPEAIAQLDACGGIEIVRDILQVSTKANSVSRGHIERREAVSLLAQITAAWHGPEHRVDALKSCAESLVTGVAELITSDCCAQTLLLCAATLNNLSRMEVTTHYSIMSNEAIFKLIKARESSDSCVSVFLHEQIVGMLHNMSLNKKCHSHLANGIIINFITSVYQTEFYKQYSSSRAESDAQRRCIKAILHTLTRLVQDSNAALGAELMEQWQNVPELFMLTNMTTATVVANAASTSLDHSGYSRDISQLARQLLHAHQQERIMLQTPGNGTGGSGDVRGSQKPAGQSTSGTAVAVAAAAAPTSVLKFNLTHQASFV